MKKGIIIGIAGASGSGKTLVAHNVIQNLYSEKVVMIQEDSYYKDLSDIPFDERTGKNFDHPDSFDHRLLAKHLADLVEGKAISHPIYDYKTHSRKDETRTVGPHTVIILEGILILSEPRLRELMDIQVFIDTAPDICFIRRLMRISLFRAVGKIKWLSIFYQQKSQPCSINRATDPERNNRYDARSKTTYRLD